VPSTRRTQFARQLRRNATEAEKRLWRALREFSTGLRFRRQHPVGPYIVDFACPGAKLAIEIDGGQHADEKAADAARTEVLMRHGYRVLRFWNNEVMDNLPGVLETILRKLSE
jgi:very-short-patch-repair endonuclease